jgi:hypothetical protein
MRRFHLGLAALALPAVALTLFVAGCGKDEKKDTSSTGGGDTTETPKELKVLAPKGGVLKGTIKLNGTPDLSALTKKLHADMKEKDHDYCMMGKETETTEQAYRIGDNGNLGNVFVWVKPDTDSFFQVDEKTIKALDKEAVIDQPHCAFVPHSLFLFPEYHADAKNPRKLTKTGQTFRVNNSAEISHNTNVRGMAQKNKGGNETIPQKGHMVLDNLVPDNAPVFIKCDIHGWMNAYMWVVDTPYYALSRSDTLTGANKAEKKDAEFGSYEITNLPVGKVRVVAWHEKCEFLNKDGAKGELIEILPGGKKTEKNFEATPK